MRRNSVIPSIAKRFSGIVTTPVRPTARTRSPMSFHACRRSAGSDETSSRERRRDPRPEIDDEGEERPDVEQDVEEDSGLRETGKKALRERQMRRRGDGQELGQALHDAEQDGLADGHRHRRIVTGGVALFGLLAGRSEPRRERAKDVQAERFGPRRRGQTGLRDRARRRARGPRGA